MRSTHLLGLRRIAFICGCGHSGTTLIATILAAHPKLFVPLKESGAYLTDQRRATRRVGGLRWQTLRAGKRYLVEKTPRHIWHLDKIRRDAEGARFIIMVRDGRDVTASLGKRLGGDFTAGLERWVEETGIALGQRHRPDVFTLRYEDLISDPPAVIRSLCAFLDVPYLDRLLDYHVKPRLWFGKAAIKRTSGVGSEHEDLRNWQVNQPIFDGRGRWRAELPPELVARFTQGRPREIMEAFGYSID